MTGGKREQQGGFADEADHLLRHDNPSEHAKAPRIRDERRIGHIPHEEGDADALNGDGARDTFQLVCGRVRIGPHHELHRALHVDQEHERKRDANRPHGETTASVVIGGG